MSPNILNVLFRSGLFGLAASAILALLPIVARDLVHGGPLTYGVMLGAFGLGAIAGAMANSRLRETFSSETIVRIAFLGFAASSGIISLSSNMALTAIVLLIPGACWVLALSLFNTTVQLSTPRWVVGRALSFYQTTTFGGIAVGSWIWGVSADAFGASVALSLASLATLVGALVGFRIPVPQFADINLDPLNRFNQPLLKLDLMPRSGPIVNLVDYIIADEDIPAFLALMSRRRRVRIRDGARQWGLMRDLEHPEMWTETYHVATWADYVRHNQRRLQADAEIWDELRKLHRGEEDPKVHRMIERQTIQPRELLPKPTHLDPH